MDDATFDGTFDRHLDGSGRWTMQHSIEHSIDTWMAADDGQVLELRLCRDKADSIVELRVGIDEAKLAEQRGVLADSWDHRLS